MAEHMAGLIEALRGKFIVFDGPDGCGKSTQHKRVEESLAAAGLEVVSCRDPGGTAIGDRIRSVLLDHDLSDMDVSCETMLFMASRAQLVAEVILPALEEGKAVLCDRFITSTCAYQGAAGYDPKYVIELARLAVGECWPHLTVILDVEPAIGFERIGRKPHHAGKRRREPAGGAPLLSGAVPDAMEARPIDFHRRVRKLFLDVHRYYPTTVMTVDGNGDANTVHQRILECLARVTF